MEQIQTVGAIALWSDATPPDGWRFCDGALLNKNDSMLLFAILADQYGGDGVTTFAVPKLGSVGNKRYIICQMGDFPRY